VPVDWKLIGYFCLGYAEEDDDVPALERERWERRQASSSFVIRR
jgi:5,6-dimethylbenzimidazole synthase